MTLDLWVVIALAGCFAIYLFLRRGRSGRTIAASPGRTQTPQSQSTYIELRNQALHGTRAKFGIAPGATPSEPWGVVMDWGIDSGTVTAVALADGSASLYLSSGGGMIGGAGSDAIRKASLEVMEIARSVSSYATAGREFPLPGLHEVTFFFLSDAGVSTYRATEAAMQDGSDPLANLGNAMQILITACNP